MRYHGPDQGRLLIADPDHARRDRIVGHLSGAQVIAAASLAEAFDLAESQGPDAIALATDLSGEPGLGMFLHLVDALGATFVLYGDRTQDRTPSKFKKSITFVEFLPGQDAAGIAHALAPSNGTAKDEEAGSVALLPQRANAPVDPPDLVVIGASTGGVNALETVLAAFPRACPPTLVVQHMRSGFVHGMIKRLDARCHPRIRAAEDGLRLQTGDVCVAGDPDRHLVVQPDGDLRCRLRPGPPRHGHRPSVDALFESVAGRRRVAAALLTGMGADGAEGLGRIRAGGGLTIAQNEATCVVYGMPRVAVETGAAALVLPLDRIAPALVDGACASRLHAAKRGELAK